VPAGWRLYRLTAPLTVCRAPAQGQGMGGVILRMVYLGTVYRGTVSPGTKAGGGDAGPVCGAGFAEPASGSGITNFGSTFGLTGSLLMPHSTRGPASSQDWAAGGTARGAGRTSGGIGKSGRRGRCGVGTRGGGTGNCTCGPRPVSSAVAETDPASTITSATHKGDLV
jgi:hypothetical protein